MKFILPLMFLLSCSPKSLQITEDILMGEGRVVEQVLQDEIGTPNFQVKLQK